jgi:hypothetical protein
MPFDPNIPQPGQPNDANVIRAQLNALNDLITGLTARVALLEPPVASGFGDPRCNGPLTQSYDWNGYPSYLTSGGARFFVADMDHYRCAPGGDPMNTMDVMYINPVSGTVKGAYTLNIGGTPPAGTVS